MDNVNLSGKFTAKKSYRFFAQEIHRISLRPANLHFSEATRLDSTKHLNTTLCERGKFASAHLSWLRLLDVRICSKSVLAGELSKTTCNITRLDETSNIRTMWAYCQNRAKRDFEQSRCYNTHVHASLIGKFSSPLWNRYHRNIYKYTLPFGDWLWVIWYY